MTAPRHAAYALRLRTLSPKAFELLRLLVEDRPRVVPKAELMQRLWPDSFVEEANLPVLVAEARATIGDAGVVAFGGIETRFEIQPFDDTATSPL